MPAATLSTALLQAALVLLVAVAGHAYAVRHLPEDVPGPLVRRIEWSVRVEPWLAGTALAMAGLGLVLLLA